MSEELNSVDPEDIEDWLIRVERAFNFRFSEGELKDVKTFGNLCDHITSKISCIHLDDCTTQQAFYKLRNALTVTLGINNVTPTTLLADILPRKNRISEMRQLSYSLGFDLSILQPPGYVFLSLWFILLISLFSFFFSAKVGVCGLLISTFGLWLASRLGKELIVENVGDLVKKIVRENYLASRRDPSTFNRNEIEDLLREWLTEDFSLSKSTLTRDAKFT